MLQCPAPAILLRSTRLALLLCAALVAMPGLGPDAMAQEAWNPFEKKEQPRSKRQAAPVEPARPALRTMDGVSGKPWANQQLGPGLPLPAGAAAEGNSGESIDRQPLPALDEKSRAVERMELEPAVTSDGTGMPLELWQGLDAKATEELVAKLEVPPRSAALFGLWRRVWTSNSTPPTGGATPAHFEALRLEVLFRSGLVAEMTARANDTGEAGQTDPLLSALRARIVVAAGDRAQGCIDARAAARTSAEMPKQIKAEMLLLSGYCAAADGNLEAAGLAAELARAEAINAPLALAALDAFTTGQSGRAALPRRVSLMDFRFLEIAGAVQPGDVIDKAEPALLVTLALAEQGDLAVRTAAGETAARWNIIDPETLATIYRLQPLPAGVDPLTQRGENHMRRAVLFKAIDGERTPMRKTRLVRALLDDARRHGLFMPIATILAAPIQDLVPAQEIGWFAETAIEINLAAGRYADARTWINFSGTDRGDGLQHWLALADIADSRMKGARGAALPRVEQLALRGRLSSDLLHRLATVLDALDYQIPIPLWEAASKTPQPATGHLPETGVLPQLADAAKRREFARTVLLAMRTLGPTGAETAHMIALGDAIRALKRAGLEPDARRLGLEAVFAAWPRTAAN